MNTVIEDAATAENKINKMKRARLSNGPAELKRGDLLQGSNDSYIIKSPIDRGGVGAVFQGQRVSDGVSVAIKVLHGGRFPMTDVARERFRKEITNTLKLKHQYLIQAYDFGKISGHDFLVMEFVSGGTIATQIERGEYDDETALRWCAQMVHGVLFLHAQGYIHRDLKPNNLLLSKSGELKISDLGIVRDISSEAYLTLSGDQIGSVLYISRRQRQAPAKADASDDAYAVGCCLYEILARRRIHVYPEHLTEVIGDRFSPYFCDIIMGCLAEREASEALVELAGLLRPHIQGESHLSPAARFTGLNLPITALDNSPHNIGLQRKRLANSVPLSLRISRKITPGKKREANFRTSYVSNDLLMAVFDSGNDGDHVPAQMFNVKNLEPTARETFSIAYPRISARDSKQRFIIPSNSQVSVYQVQPSAPFSLRQVHSIAITGLKFYSMTIAANRYQPIVSIGSWTEAPVLANTDTCECRRLKVDASVEWNGLGQTAFLGAERLVVHHSGHITVYQIDPNGNDHVLARYPFPQELVGIAASEKLGAIFACSGHRLECIDATNGTRKWVLPLTYSPGGPPLLLNPAEDVLAVECSIGFSEKSLALIDPTVGAMVHLPRSFREGGESWRSMISFDWSPSSKGLCVCYEDGMVEIFQCGEPLAP
jgi:serine/threonine protein kinase